VREVKRMHNETGRRGRFPNDEQLSEEVSRTCRYKGSDRSRQVLSLRTVQESSLPHGRCMVDRLCIALCTRLRLVWNRPLRPGPVHLNACHQRPQQAFLFSYGTYQLLRCPIVALNSYYLQ
jgi:hypothetical protein